MPETAPINIPTMNKDGRASPCLPRTPPSTPVDADLRPSSPSFDRINFPDESTKPPSYLTKEFIEKALHDPYPDIKIKHMQFFPAVGVGENYMSVVYRVHVISMNNQSFSLIIKCIPENESRAKLSNENGITEREMAMYSNIINKSFKQYTPNDPKYKFNTPICYYTLKEDSKDIIILNDLQPEGYNLAKRQQGLDYHHVKLALFELAKFHAYSIKLRIDNIDEFNKEILNNETFHEAFYTTRNKEMFEEYMSLMFATISNTIKERLPYRYHSIGDVIKTTGPYMFQWMSNLFKMTDEMKTGKVLVLNHGDYWCNNMLFKYDLDNKQAINCSMIDFQIAKCATPTWDLLYFLMSSTIKPIRDLHMDEFLQFYIDNVYLTLESLNIKKEQMPKNYFFDNIEELKQEINDHSLIAFITATMLLPIVVANTEDAPDMDEFDDKDIKAHASKFFDLIKNQIYLNRLKDFLDEYDDKGFFKMLLDKIPPTNNIDKSDSPSIDKKE